MENGAQLTVYSGGVADFIAMSGGYEYVSSGSMTTNGMISGGAEAVLAGGTPSLAAAAQNGTIEVQFGGTVISSVLSGGLENVRSGGSASGTAVDSGGNQTVYLDGEASGAVISGGGTMQVDARGTVATIAAALRGSFDLPSLAYTSEGSAIVGGNDVLTVTEGGGSATLPLSGVYGGEVFSCPRTVPSVPCSLWWSRRAPCCGPAPLTPASPMPGTGMTSRLILIRRRCLRTAPTPRSF